MIITPISGPRTAPILGAKTVAAETLRTAAIEKFNQGLQASGSPSQPGAVLDPQAAASTELTTSLSQETAIDAPEAQSDAQASSQPPTDAADLEAKRIASHYANLARKEKMLRMREARIRDSMRSQVAPTQQTPQFDPSKYVSRDELVQNPFGVLNNLGLTYEQLTQKALDAPTAEDLQQRREIEALKSELKTLREGQDQVKRTFDENQTMARRQAELQIRQDVTRLVQQDPNFEVIRANRGTGAIGEVVRLITSVYDEGMGPDYPRGTILDVADAAQMVESELTQRTLRSAKLQKIQRLISNKASTQQPQTQNQQPTQNALRTLTNGVGTSTRKLTPRERAIAVFRGEAV
jgi:hypothetical protein